VDEHNTSTSTPDLAVDSAADLTNLVDPAIAATAEVEEPVVAATIPGFHDEAAQASPADDLTVEPEPVEVAVAEVPEGVFDPLTSELGDMDELQLDGFYKDINAEHIRDLPAPARRMLHNFRAAYELKKQEHAKVLAEKDKSVSERQGNLDKMERDFARRQAEFHAMMGDPKLKEILKVSEKELPDPFTPEGIQARIDRGVAESMNRMLEPMQQTADKRMRESAYLDFVDKSPEMKDAGFRNEVVGLVRERREAGQPLTTQDAYQLVKARKVMAQQQARAAKERRTRSESARHITRTAASSTPGHEEIPTDIKKRGAVQIAKWLQSNPEAARRIQNTRN